MLLTVKNGDYGESDDAETGTANGDEPADAWRETGVEDEIVVVLSGYGDSEEIHRERFST